MADCIHDDDKKLPRLSDGIHDDDKKRPRLSESQVMKSQELGPLVRLMNMVSGNIVIWPGVCTRDNGWTINASKFSTRDLVGSTVVTVDVTTGEIDSSIQMKISAVLSCSAIATGRAGSACEKRAKTLGKGSPEAAS